MLDIRVQMRQADPPSAESVISEATWNLLDGSLTLWFLDGAGIIVCGCNWAHAAGLKRLASERTIVTWQEAKAVLF